MMKNIIIIFLTCIFSQQLMAQNVGINTVTPHASAQLDITANNKGLLIPRIALTDNMDVTTIQTPASSLLIYNTATAGTGRFMVTPGFYYWNNLSSSWIAFVPGDNSVKGAWLLGGNIATSLATNFLGTTDNQSLLFKINNTNAGFLGTAGNTFWGLNSGNINSSGNNNTATGSGSLLNNTTGYSNVAFGTDALRRNTTKSNLVAIGDSALFNNGVGAINDQGDYNTAVGSKSLFANTLGYANSALGKQALYSNTTGALNNAFGYQALMGNTTGNLNSAIGYLALGGNSTGNNNIAHGYVALSNNKTGNGNVAIGSQVLGNSVNGSNIVAIGDSVLANYNNNVTSLTSLFGNNTAVGSKSLYSSTVGTSNSAFGSHTLYSNETGNFNVAVGGKSLFSNITGGGNVAIGVNSMQQNISGSKNTGFGYNATVGNSNLVNATAIGADAIVDCNNCMALGSIAGQNGATNNIKVGIGISSPLSPLHIKQTNDIYPVVGGGLRLERNANLNHWEIGTDNSNDLDFSYNNGVKAFISSASGLLVSPSDLRLKKDINLIGTVLPAIMKLQPKTYHYKTNEDGSPLSYGFIAQEVEKFFPDFVTTKGPDNMKAIAYQEFTIVAIKAIQEQQTIIETQQKQMDALQKENKIFKENMGKLEAAIEAIHQKMK